MNKTLSYIALGLAIIALAVSSAVALSGGNQQSLFGGVSCSGVSGCTAFPGILRSDINQSGASAPLGSGPLVVTWASGGATTTALVSNFDCLYDAINLNGGTNTSTAMQLTLPTATSTNQGIIGTAPACLSVDGASDNTLLIVANATNTVTVATSTGDILVWNASSSLSGVGGGTNVLPSSSLTYYINLQSYRTNSSTVVYTLTQIGTQH